MSLWVLKTPSGVLVERTVATDRSMAWSLAHTFLIHTDPTFGIGSWKRAIAAARRRGWHIVRARLEEIPKLGGRTR